MSPDNRTANALQQLDDDAFLTCLTKFAAAEQPDSESEIFCDHECRLRLAWLNLRDKPWPIALADTCSILRALPADQGGQNSYHHTVTVAALRLILQRIKHQPELEFERFVAENRDLAGGFKALIRAYYSDDLLARSSAQVTFVQPDKRPLDG